MNLTEYIFKARSGLVKKVVTVTRNGKTFPMTVWVKPDEGEDRAFTKKEQYNGKDEYTSRLSKEFRGLQESSLRLSDAEVKGFHGGSTEPDERLRGGLSRILGEQIARFRSSDRYDDSSFVNKKHGTTFEILSNVNPHLFHDVIQIVRQYLYSGDTVDIHDDYSEAKCYLSSDGLAGFAIEPDGNLVSVFSLKKGFTPACGKYMVEQGARKLDCYSSRLIDLPAVYKHTLGFEVASILDFNREMLEKDRGKEYADHFVSTYGEASVMFMVRGENIPVRHFGKDDYDEAVAYQNSFLTDRGVHKSLIDCLLLKSRSGVYQDNAENRRLHRVGQRYGSGARPSFNKEEVSRTSAVEQFRAKAEKFLSSMEGVDFHYVDSSTTNGASVYFKVSRKDGKGDTLKFRISDHSVTNRDRVVDEVHYSNSDPEQTRNEIYYRLGFPGYKYGKTTVTLSSGRRVEAFGYYKEEVKSTYKSLTALYLLKSSVKV